MKLTKMLTAVAVTSTVIAAMAMSASADFSAEYVAPTGTETGKVTLTDLSPATGDHTLLVLNRDVFGDFTDGEEGEVTVDPANIVQIDQAATFDTVVVGDLAADIDAANQKLLDDYAAIEDPTPEQFDNAFTTWKESQTYYVRVGGGSTIDVAQITANTTKVNTNTRPEEVPDEPEGPVVSDVKADIDCDSMVTFWDALEFLLYDAGEPSMFDQYNEEQIITIGDIDDDSMVSFWDALEVLLYDAGEPSMLDEYLE